MNQKRLNASPSKGISTMTKSASTTILLLLILAGCKPTDSNALLDSNDSAIEYPITIVAMTDSISDLQVALTVNNETATLPDWIKGNTPRSWAISLDAADGSDYRLTALATPAGKNCTTYNDIGTVSGASLTITIACRSWTPESTVSAPSGDSTKYELFVNSVLRYSDTGDLHIVWRERNGSDEIWGAHKSLNESWTVPEKISTNGATNHSQWNSFDFGFDGMGNAHLVFENIGLDYAMFDGSSWGSPIAIAVGASGFAREPRIGVDGLGNAIVVYDENKRIWANKFDLSAGWTAPHIVSAGDFDAGSQSISMVKTGVAFIGWFNYESDNTGRSYGTTVYTDNRWDEFWDNPTRLEDFYSASGATGQDTLATDIDQTDKDHRAAIWSKEGGDVSGSVWATIFDTTTGKWPAAIRVDRHAYDNYSYAPNIVLLPNGEALAVWVQDRPALTLWSSHYLTSLGWTEPEKVNLATNNAMTIAEEWTYLIVDSDGNAWATWAEDNGSGSGTGTTDIFAARYHFNTGWDVPEMVSDGNTDAQAPTIATDDFGNVAIAWRQLEADNTYSMHVREYSF
jgi:hypothetical protein